MGHVLSTFTHRYRAFRLLQSDLGKIFFKTLGPNEVDHFSPRS